MKENKYYCKGSRWQAGQDSTQGVTGASLNDGLSGESGDRLVTVQTVHTDCTPVQRNNFCTGAVDWTQVGGGVLEEVEVAMFWRWKETIP